MLGFGALRAMNDAVKSNREALKAGKKDFFDRSSDYAFRTGTLVLKEKPVNPEVIALIRASAQRDARRERIKSIVILCLSVVLLCAFLVLYSAWVEK
jgi:hypothetical protein